MGLEPLKTLERKIRHYIRGNKYSKGNLPPDEKFYWHVSHVFTSVLGDGCVSVTMPPNQPAIVRVGQEATEIQLRLTSPPGSRETTLEQFDGDAWNPIGEYHDRQAAILKGLKITVAAMQSQIGDTESAELRQRIEWILTENGQRIPRMLNLGEQWTTSLHRSGWGYALNPLKSLHNENGVIFDGFLEATFCWKDTGKVYTKPWVGVIHNPPKTPKWANQGKASNKYMMNTERWAQSRKNCKGIFVLSEYHKKALQERLDVPISVLHHPTETPDLKFSWSRFTENPEPRLIQVGHWLRNPNSLYKLKTNRLTKARLDVGHPWEEKSRTHMRSEPLDLESVELIPRVDNDEYDELLSKNVVFLDLLDSSANNAIIECIVRNTPILVNRIEPVVEYLGEDYPLYFDDLKEAGRKADDPELIRAAHLHLVKMPKQQFSQEAFLHSVVQSEVYQSLMPTPLDKFVLLAHARSGSSTLHHILNAHDEIRMSYEPFNPKRENWKQYNYHNQITDDAALKSCLDEIYCYHTGMKHLIYQLEDRQNEMLLNRDLKRIFLHRQNLLQTIVSGFIAEQTKKWAGNRGEILKARLEPLDLKEVEKRIQWLGKSVDHYRRFMVDNGLDFLEVKYEDLYGEQCSVQQKLEQVDRIFSYLGAGQASESARQQILEVINPDASKINTTETYRRIPNVAELEKKLGNSETGFLFTESFATPSVARQAA